MFDKIKAKIDELKAEIDDALKTDEVKADESSANLLSGWSPALEALKRVLSEKEVPAPVETPPEEPAQDAKGDASEPESEAPGVQVEPEDE